MELRTPSKDGVYVEFRDKKRRRKRACLTIDGVTPRQAADFLKRCLREHQRKAG